MADNRSFLQIFKSITITLATPTDFYKKDGTHIVALHYPVFGEYNASTNDFLVYPENNVDLTKVRTLVGFIAETSNKKKNPTRIITHGIIPVPCHSKVEAGKVVYAESNGVTQVKPTGANHVIEVGIALKSGEMHDYIPVLFGQ